MKHLAGLAVLFLTAAGTAAELPDYFREEVKTVYPEAVSFPEISGNEYSVRDGKGKVVGKVYTEKFDSAKRKYGYAGTVEVAVLMDTENKVAGVLIGKNNETPRFLDRVRRAGFLKQWNKLRMQEIPDRKIEAVTRATLSSRAIEHGVRQIAESNLNLPLEADKPEYAAVETARLKAMRSRFQSFIEDEDDPPKHIVERLNTVNALLKALEKDGTSGSK